MPLPGGKPPRPPKNSRLATNFEQTKRSGGSGDGYDSEIYQYQ